MGTTTKQVLEDLQSLINARAELEPFTYFLSARSDRMPYLRTRIDYKLASLGSGFEQEVLGEEDLLGLVADFVEYYVALLNAPIPYYPTAEDYTHGEAPAIKEVIK